MKPTFKAQTLPQCSINDPGLIVQRFTAILEQEQYIMGRSRPFYVRRARNKSRVRATIIYTIAGSPLLDSPPDNVIEDNMNTNEIRIQY
jgi:hypothetical protein